MRVPTGAAQCALARHPAGVAAEGHGYDGVVGGFKDSHKGKSMEGTNHPNKEKREKNASHPLRHRPRLGIRRDGVRRGSRGSSEAGARGSGEGPPKSGTEGGGGAEEGRKEGAREGTGGTEAGRRGGQEGTVVREVGVPPALDVSVQHQESSLRRSAKGRPAQEVLRKMVRSV